MLPAISLTSLQVFPTISASSSIVCLPLPLSLALLHVSYPTAIIIFCAVRVAHNNAVKKMWKCAASPAASIDGLNEVTYVSCHIVIDLQCSEIL